MTKKKFAQICPTIFLKVTRKSPNFAPGRSKGSPIRDSPPNLATPQFSLQIPQGDYLSTRLTVAHSPTRRLVSSIAPNDFVFILTIDDSICSLSCQLAHDTT